MKKYTAIAIELRLAASALCLFALSGLMPTLAHAFDGYIEIENNTGYDIYYIYISNENTTSWEEDVLEDDILEDGETFKVTVEGYESSIFDVKLVDEDGDSYTYWDVDIAKNDIVALTEHIDVESDNGIEGYIEVTNKTGYVIYYLYISHEDSSNWEEDVLNDAVLAVGDSVRVDITGYSTSIFDVRAEDEDGDTYTVYGIDISTDDLVFTKKHLD